MIEVVTEEMHGSDRVPDLKLITRRALVGSGKYFHESEMALFPSARSGVPRKVLDSADIVRDACLQQVRECIRITRMSRAFIVAPFVLITAVSLCQSTESPCWKAAVTQLEMNRCANLDAQAADGDLNRVYGQLLFQTEKRPCRHETVASRATCVDCFSRGPPTRTLSGRRQAARVRKHISDVLRASECRHY